MSTDTWKPPCPAWIFTKAKIKRYVWVHHITECGRYASVSFSRKGAKHHPVLVSELRKPEERYLRATDRVFE